MLPVDYYLMSQEGFMKQRIILKKITQHFQKRKTFLSFLLIMLLTIGSFIGCSNSSVEEITSEKKQQTAKGRFLEEEMTLPEGIEEIETAGVLADGSLRILTLSQDTTKRLLYSSDDNGKTWKEQTLPDELDAQKCIYIYRAAFSVTGQLFVSGDFENDEGNFENWFFDTDGSGKQLSISFPKTDTENKEDGWDNFVTDAVFSENGNLYIADVKGQAYQIDTKSGDIIENNGKSAIGSTGDAFVFGCAGKYLILAGGNNAVLYDTTAKNAEIDDTILKKEIDGQNLSENSDDIKSVVFAGGKDGIFFATQKGVYYHTVDGSVIEQIINGELNTIGNPNVGLKNLWYLDENHFLLLCKNEEGENILFQYTYSEDTPTVPENELIVYSLEDSSEVRQAISVFQKENQDVYVNYIVGKNSDNAVTTDDALRTLNSEIMAGKGPDVLILDGMPVQNYIEKGLLLDIHDIKDTIEKSDGIFENLCDVYGKDNAVYGIPSRFLFSFIQGDKNEIEKGNNLKILANYLKNVQSSSDIAPIINCDAVTLLRQLLYADSANWISGSTVDATALKDFFASVKTIYDLNPDKETAMSTEISGAEMKFIGSNGCIDIMMDNIALNIGTVQNSYSFTMLISSNKSAKDKNLDYKLLADSSKKIFLPLNVAGVSSKSNHLELAKEFIITLLSKDVNAVDGDGLPINKAAYQQMIDNAIKYGSNGSLSFSNNKGEIRTFDMSVPEEKDIEKLTSIIESLDTASSDDAVIQELIVEQGKKYLYGTQSIEDSVNNVIQKVNLYLAE